MKKNGLSILIPTYNGDCRAMVEELSCQAQTLVGLDYEIIVADDGSTDPLMAERCSEVEKLPHCRFIAREQNVGRAAIRNFLASQASLTWLLFLDCDMDIISQRFLTTYLDTEGDVIYGGYKVGPGEKSCLRYIYEKANEPQHTATQRQTRPYQHFHTANFLIRRDILLEHPFDEQFTHYGYEDVLLGRRLREASVPVSHIDNPAGFNTFEDNASFVAKTEEGLRTLYEKRDLLRGYSRLITYAEGIHLNAARWLIRNGHRLLGPLERKLLCSKHPSLKVFKIYKLGYYLNIKA